MNEPQLKPQLAMRRHHLEDLPELALPEGYRIRGYRAGDEEAWNDIISSSFEPQYASMRFDTDMVPDPAFRPERVFFVERDDEPVGTASAWYVPVWGCDTGTVHMVAVKPAHQGRSLGQRVSLAAMYQMRADGRKAAALRTDDFRLAAVTIYLRLGFEPLLVHENQRRRWPEVFAAIGRAELADTFADILGGPVLDLTLDGFV